MDIKYILGILALVALTFAAPRERRNVARETTERPDPTEEPSPTPEQDQGNDATDDGHVHGGAGVKLESDDEVKIVHDTSVGHGQDQPHIYGLDHGEELTENHTVVCQWGHCWVVKPEPPPQYANDTIAWVAGHWDILVIAFVAFFCLVAAIYLFCSDKTKYYSEHEYQKDHRNDDGAKDKISKKEGGESVRNSGTPGHYNKAFVEEIGAKPKADPTPIIKPPTAQASGGFLDWAVNKSEQPDEKKERRKSSRKDKEKTGQKDVVRLDHGVSEPVIDHREHPQLKHKETDPSALIEHQKSQGASFLQINKPVMPARPVSPSMRRRREEAGLPPSPDPVESPPVFNTKPVFTLGGPDEDSPPDTPPTPPKVSVNKRPVMNGLHESGHSEPVLDHTPSPPVPTIHVEHSEPALLVTDPETNAPTFLEVKRPMGMPNRPVSPAMRKKKIEAEQQRISTISSSNC